MGIDQVVQGIEEWLPVKARADVYRAYYRGAHTLRFMTPEFQARYGARFSDLRENLCPGIVGAFTDQISIASWGNQADDKAAEALGLLLFAGKVHREVWRCGEAYGLAWDTRGPRGQRVAAYHRADQMIGIPNPEDPAVLSAAIKTPWWDPMTRRARVNVYGPDRVERWQTIREYSKLADCTPGNLPAGKDGWEPCNDPDGPEIPHTFGVVPVCWWKRDDDDPTGHGESILRDVIPLQDTLNGSVANACVLEDSYAQPFWYLLNYAPPKGTGGAGGRSPFQLLAEDHAAKIAAGKIAEQAAIAAATSGITGTKTAGGTKFDRQRQSIFTHDGPGPFGQLQPPDLSRLDQHQDKLALKMCRVVGLPAYYMTQTSGEVPSGASLRALKVRMTNAVVSFERDAEPVWRGMKELLGMSSEAVQWAPVEILDPTEAIDVALGQQALGYALADIVEDLGESDPDGIVKRALEAKATNVAAMGSALLAGQINPNP